MLTSLTITNLALVDDLEIEFGSGFNVITGETGAGKSILMGALGLVMGDRADKGMIRTGEAKCTAEAVFLMADVQAIDKILDDAGLELCADGQLIIRRIVSAAGSNKNIINGGSTTLSVLREVGDLLVDMHGPYDHQSLLNPAYQLSVLDSFAGLEKTRESYATEYRAFQAVLTRLGELDMDEQEVSRRLDLLQYQVDEIQKAQLKEGEEEEVLEEHALNANAQNIVEESDAVCQALVDDPASAFNALVTVQQSLNRLSEMLPEGQQWVDEAEAIAVQVQELYSSVSSRAQTVDCDPTRLEWLDDRLATYSSMRRKYGQSIPAIITFFEKSERELFDLQNRDEHLQQLRGESEAARARVFAEAEGLRKARLSAAGKLAKAITEECRDLGFPQSKFSVDLKQVEPGPTGMDQLDFGFAPNPGEEMRSLRAIASSGEISRVMLATKAVLARHDCIPVLVFDEIDANLGGETGAAVGEKLLKVAGNHQVLCITHLPQVAVCGQTHQVVRKEVVDDRTFTRVEEVAGDARAEEVARMLGGKDSTSVILEHARELLKG